MILFGHQTGNPNAHHAALAHYEAGRLDAFVLPWFPSRMALGFLHLLPFTRELATRLERRRFEPLANAPKIQGRLGEFKRLAIRAFDKGDEGLSYQVNDWLMRTMARACHRTSVTAVHSYEDASLWPFQKAKTLGKACIYDMPIGYYSAWQETEADLAKRYVDWLPPGGLPSHRFARPEQKKREMELADVVLVPSSFVERTISRFLAKNCIRAAYGVDSTFWKPADVSPSDHSLRFIYAGQLSIRKGTPILLEAWNNAQLPNADLLLVGSWCLSDRSKRYLNDTVKYVGPCSSLQLRNYYQTSDVFVFPSFFEGFGLVLLEAMACGLAILASDATAAPDIIDDKVGRIVPSNMEQWIEALREIARIRDRLPEMKKAARERATGRTWQKYREAVSAAVKPFC
jgi:starch synthase